MGRLKPVKGVGYWYWPTSSPLMPSDRFPDPRGLVRPGWRASERARIIRYLRSGWVYAQWRGLSWCRFRCGTRPGEMGSRCLTDGIWVYPEGLAHYVECHDVCLPSEFIRTMRRRHWRIPDRTEPPRRETHDEPDYSFWLAWTQKQLRKKRTS